MLCLVPALDPAVPADTKLKRLVAVRKFVVATFLAVAVPLTELPKLIALAVVALPLAVHQPILLEKIDGCSA